MHKIRTLFWSRIIKRLARWRGSPRLRASLQLGGSGIKKRGVATTHRCILRCLTQPGFEASKPHACVERLIKPREIPFSWYSLGAKKKKAWLRQWSGVSELGGQRDGQQRRAGVLLSLLFRVWRWISFFCYESDDRPHLSPEHCHLLPAVITRLLRRCSPQHLREGTSWRWPLHKVESCSRAWIHVDTLKITAKGQGKDSSASQSQWERTSRYPFVEWSKEKNRTLMAPVIAGLPEGRCKCHPLAGQFDLVQRVSFHVNGLVNSYLNWDWYWKKMKEHKRCLFRDRSDFTHKEDLARKTTARSSTRSMVS